MGSVLSYFLEIVFLLAVGKMLARAMQGLFRPAPPHGVDPAAQREGTFQVRTGKTKRDPVCGMFVSTELSRRLVRGSETVHFCSDECLERYKKETANVSV